MAVPWAAQHDLATSNLSRLDPTWWQTMLFVTHPDPVWRISQARAWAARPGQAVLLDR